MNFTFSQFVYNDDMWTIYFQYANSSRVLQDIAQFEVFGTKVKPLKIKLPCEVVTTSLNALRLYRASRKGD